MHILDQDNFIRNNLEIMNNVQLESFDTEHILVQITWIATGDCPQQTI